MKTKSKIEGVAFSRAGFMRTFNCNWRKVESYISEKMPVHTVGGKNPDGSPRAWVFDSIPCARFLDARSERKGREEAEARRAGRFLKPLHPSDPRYAVADAQARRTTQRTNREAAQTLCKEDAVAIADEIFTMLRAHFGKVPGAVVEQLKEQLGATGEKLAKVERLLKREVAAALSGLDAREIAEIELPSESESELA